MESRIKLGQKVQRGRINYVSYFGDRGGGLCGGASADLREKATVNTADIQSEESSSIR